MKMENLRTILLKLQGSLVDLEALLIAEVAQLQRTQINPVSLQIVSDNKSQLLSTISHYDDLRKQQESILKISVPYEHNPRIAASWEEIIRKVKRANDLNSKVAELLDLHMKKGDQLMKMVNKAGSTLPVYSSDGQSNLATSGKVYNISV
ncbi:flagellar export chaperone FlgN [Scandinavium sp.]|uniref:flagella synthesis protein FlgN n=1 Tax=Scandinavium sp. TaxID=2830653 RepID=UPI00289AC25A|nr:flagellar export chaperone FlgN [Scandinavium sp.]